MRTLTYTGTKAADWMMLSGTDAALVVDAGDGNDGVQGGLYADLLRGGAGDDQLWGNGGDDTLMGDAGNDMLWGGDGNDSLDGGAGNDMLWGGEGNDTLTLGDGNDQAWGENGDDKISTGSGDDVVWAGAGNDTVDGGTGNDTIHAEAGDDSVQAGEGNNTVSGGDGTDTIRAGAGNDTLSGDNGNDLITAGDGNNLVWGGWGDDTITSGAGNDTLSGDDGNDRISAGAGDDILWGGQGDDTLNGEAGNDLITGDNGADSLLGGDGNDTLYGGEGNDTINPGSGADIANGDGGDDLIIFASGGQRGDVFDGGVGTDTLRLDLTRDEWFNPTTQAEIAGFLAKLARGDGSPFAFTILGLTARQFEQLGVTVDGRTLTAQDDPVTARADNYTVSEDDVLSGTVLDNDSVPDLVAALALLSGPSAGTLVLGADGAFTLDARAAFQSLGAGQTARLSFRYQVTDADGDTGTACATVTVQGVNDAASITGTATGTVTEDGTLSASGKLLVADVDAGQAVFAKPAALAGTYGSFGFDAATGAWSYALNNKADIVQSLKAGQVVQDVMKVASLDGTASQSIVVNVQGVNDAASITGTATGTVTEDGTLSASGKLLVADADAGQAVFAKLAAAALAGTYGTFGFDDATGAWSYALNNKADIVQALKTGQVVQDVLKVASMDGTASQSIVVSINGTNEVATNLLVNGGFEQPVIAPYLNNWMPRSDVPGWTSTAKSIEVWNNFLVKPSEGNQNIEIDWSNAYDAISQTVDVVAGQQYLLTFDAQARRAGQATSEAFNVLWDGKVLGRIDPTFGSWTTYKFLVEGHEGPDTVTFAELAEGNDSQGGLLDNVQLRAWDL